MQTNLNGFFIFFLCSSTWQTTKVIRIFRWDISYHCTSSSITIIATVWAVSGVPAFYKDCEKIFRFDALFVCRLFLRHFIFITVHHAWNTCGIDWQSDWKWKIKIEKFQTMLIPLQKPSPQGCVCFSSQMYFLSVHWRALLLLKKWEIIQRNNPLISVLKCSIRLLSVCVWMEN